MNSTLLNAIRMPVGGLPVELIILIDHAPLDAMLSLTVIPPKQLVKLVLVMEPTGGPPAVPLVTSDPMSLTSHWVVASADLRVSFPPDVAVIAPPGVILTADAVAGRRAAAAKVASMANFRSLDIESPHRCVIEWSLAGENDYSVF
jgi:hypothetical protein